MTPNEKLQEASRLVTEAMQEIADETKKTPELHHDERHRLGERAPQVKFTVNVVTHQSWS